MTAENEAVNFDAPAKLIYNDYQGLRDYMSAPMKKIDCHTLRDAIEKFVDLHPGNRNSARIIVGETDYSAEGIKQLHHILHTK